MGGRGSFAIGKNVNLTYNTVGVIEDAKILEGVNKQYHALPEESHSSNIYIKLNKDGTFREMRIYGKDHYAIMDIAYHYEGNLVNDKNGKVLHYHTYDKDFHHSKAMPLTKELYDKYKKYMKGVNYD